MKIAPLVHQLASGSRGADWLIVHTGQHYDYEMSRVFFDELDIPQPDYFLGAGSGSHAEQTAKIMVEFEKVCLDEKPDVVVVVGDVNSTLACAVTAKKLNIKVAHVEAGLRSRDMTMPEEINRIVTDSISDYLFVTEKSGIENLKSEGKEDRNIFFVGNVMIDTLFHQMEMLKGDAGAGRSDIDGRKISGPYAVVTLHRPSNVDKKETLTGIMKALIDISRDMEVVFPAHPRTKQNIEAFDLLDLVGNSRIEIVPPLPYRSFLRLWKDASLVLTDSGGLQEETTALGIACFTIRENTERPITIEEGTNRLVGTAYSGIISAYEAFKRGEMKGGRVPKYWDGKAAARILAVLGDEGQPVTGDP